MYQRSYLTKLEAWIVIGLVHGGEDGKTQVARFTETTVYTIWSLFWIPEMQAEDEGNIVDVQQCSMKIDI